MVRDVIKFKAKRSTIYKMSRTYLKNSKNPNIDLEQYFINKKQDYTTNMQKLNYFTSI